MTTEHPPLNANERPYPGALVIVEGVDGSGKSTQLFLIKRWLELEGYRVFHTEWNSSGLVREITKRSKKARLLTPFTFSLLHAADFADRLERQIMPLLHAGYIVLADRYIYTALARDAARGCPIDWVRNLYSLAPRPDLSLYYRAPLDVSLGRILRGRPALKWHEAGMDLGLSHDPLESFRLFQGMIQQAYDGLVETDGLVVMDATQDVHELQQATREAFTQRIDLERFRGGA